MSTDLLSPLLERPLTLHPQVALRPEPFGALAYHYGNRRLVFLQHVDMVALARELAAHPTLSAALQACGIDQRRWPSFTKAVESLMKSEIIVER